MFCPSAQTSDQTVTPTSLPPSTTPANREYHNKNDYDYVMPCRELSDGPWSSRVDHQCPYLNFYFLYSNSFPYYEFAMVDC